jgi:hypothetical protein
MKTWVVGAMALLSSLTALPAAAAPMGGHGGGHYGGGHYAGGHGAFGGYARGYGYGGWGYRGGVGYRGGWGHGGYGPAYYHRGPYVGPYYWGWYGGCRREWVWVPAWGGYQLLPACY